jgi:hypothetical protein
MTKLDNALTTELEKESGSSELPAEVRSNLVEAENVIGTWSYGTRKIVATTKRLFIQSGWISRKTIEFPYRSITSIEYTRRYEWGILLFGSLLSTFLLIEPSLRPIFSRTLLSRIEQLLHLTLQNNGFPLDLPSFLADSIPLLPICAAIIIFAFQARKGFSLHGVSSKPIYLPHSFDKAIKYIRSRMNTARRNEEAASNLEYRA